MWPYFAPNLASLGRSFLLCQGFGGHVEGLLPRFIKFVRYCGGSTRLGRRMHDKVGIVAKVTESFGQEAKVTVPEELIGADGEVGVEKDFQGIGKVM